eukprot:3156491-Pyramimonas_sp.AAC.1
MVRVGQRQGVYSHLPGGEMGGVGEDSLDNGGAVHGRVRVHGADHELELAMHALCHLRSTHHKRQRTHSLACTPPACPTQQLGALIIKLHRRRETVGTRFRPSTQEYKRCEYIDEYMICDYIDRVHR